MKKNRLALVFSCFNALVFSCFLVACASGKPTQPKDGGSGGSGGGVGTDAPPVACTPNVNFCEGKDLAGCDELGHSVGVIEVCPDTCSFGRCTTTRCATAETIPSAIGCLFYGLDTDNTMYDDTQVFGFPIGNQSLGPVNVTIEKSISKDTWTTALTGVVAPGEINYFRLALAPKKGDDYHIEGTGKAYKAYRITSDGPIVAYQINADDEEGESYNSGSTLLLPLHVLGQHFYAITPPDRGISGMGDATNGPDHSFIDVVGVKNNTKVVITVKGEVMAGGSIMAMDKDELRSFIINEGEVIQLETPGSGNDLTGSEITSDKPVVVYAGNTCGGFDPKRLIFTFNSCDHIVETMYPVKTWGKMFVFLDLRMPLHIPSKSIWGRIVASEDATMLTFDAPRMLPGLPATATLNKGEVLALEITDPSTIFNHAHFAITANKPIEVESFMGEQEGGAIIVPTDQFMDDYLVSTHPWFTGYLLITRKIGTPVMVDGMLLPDYAFKPGGNGYEVSFLAAERCEADLKKCAHRVTGTEIGVTVTANGGVCNYCYVGGAAVRCVNKATGCR